MILEVTTSLSDIVGLKNQQAQRGLKPGIPGILSKSQALGPFGQESL